VNPATAEFYKGKTITFYLGGTAGSASDAWCRLIAKYLPDITGTKVIVQNEPAGTGRMIFNQFATTIKPDGLSICYSGQGLMWPPYLLSDSGVQYDITKFVYLLGAETGNPLIDVKPNGKYKTIDDLMKTSDLRFAHSSKTATITMANALAIDLLKLKGVIVTGFDGDTGRQLALQQGDADGTVTAPDTTVIGMAKGTYFPVLQIGTTRTKPFMDVPALMELVKTDSLNDTQKRLVGSIDVLGDSKTIFTAPGTPQDRVDFLAASLKKLYDNKAFQEENTKLTGSAIGDYVTGQELTKRANAMVAKKGDMPLWTDLLNKYIK
jgi:tripartite-type tricarboxylate transporter receptor subunit TctC